jgi:hypothetical protein
LVSARTRLTKAEFRALARGDRRFLHLVDGGVSDNLGIRRITDYVAQPAASARCSSCSATAGRRCGGSS